MVQVLSEIVLTYAFLYQVLHRANTRSLADLRLLVILRLENSSVAMMANGGDSEQRYEEIR